MGFKIKGSTGYEEKLSRDLYQDHVHSTPSQSVPILTPGQVRSALLPTKRRAGSPGAKAPLFAQVELLAVDTLLVEVVGPVPGH